MQIIIASATGIHNDSADIIGYIYRFYYFTKHIKLQISIIDFELYMQNAALISILTAVA